MMKLKQILIEEEVSGLILKVLTLMLRQNLDPEDVVYNYETLGNDFLLNDSELIGNAVLLYQKYHDIAEENGTFKDIPEMNLEFDEGDIDDELIALGEHLEMHPLLLKDDGYGYYVSLISGEEYRVLDESSAQAEFEERADEFIDEYLSNSGDIGWLSHYLELNEYELASYASEEAEYRVDDMDAEDIIDEMGAEDELERRISNAHKKKERWNELDTLIVDAEYEVDEIVIEIEDLKEEANDYRTEASNASTSEEVSDLENEYRGVLATIKEKREMLEYWEEELEDMRFEFEELDKDWDDVIYTIEQDLADELKGDLMETMEESITQDANDRGWEYFSDIYGYTAADVIDKGLADIDREGAIESLESDRGNIMSSYDGEEWEEYVNGETYYIYRHN